MKFIFSHLLLFTVLIMFGGGTCYAGDASFKTPSWYKKTYSSMLERLSGQNRTDSINHLTMDALDQYPNNSIAHELRGRYYVFLGNHVNGVLRNDKVPPTKANKENYRRARYHLIKALELDNGNITARQNMLNVETLLGEYSSALIYCNELLEVQPYDAGLWRRKIALYRHLGNDVEADRLTRRYMSIFTDDVTFKRGEAARREDKLKHDILAERTDTLGYLASQRETNLREMIALNPKRPAYYYYLLSYLSGNGRMEEALEVAGTAANMCQGVKSDTEDGHVLDSRWFIEKRVAILCDLNRTQEAENYLLNLRKQGTYSNEKLLTDVRLTMARSSKMNDPYEAYAYIYDNTHSKESLDYLINTAIQRGYYDDALAYIGKVKTPDWQMKLKEYTVLKRMGNTSKAIKMLTADFLKSLPVHPKDYRHDPVCDLMQYRLREAKDMMGEGMYAYAIAPLKAILDIDITNIKLDGNDDILYYRESALSSLYTCYLNTKKHELAVTVLDSLYHNYRKGAVLEKTLRLADLYVAQDSVSRALSLLTEHVSLYPADSRAVTSAYEEIAVPYIKSLIDTHQIKKADDCLTEAIAVCPYSLDLMTYGVNVAQTLGRKSELEVRIAQGLEKYPDNRYFNVKKAQLLQSRRQYDEAIRTVEPLFDTYYGDSVIIGVYAENNYKVVDSLLKKHEDNYLHRVSAICNKAEEIIPGNRLMLRARGRYYEALSKDSLEHCLAHKALADSLYRLCKDEFDSPAEYRRITNQLYNDSRHNELSFEYLHGISGEDATRTGTAYMSYKRISDRGDECFLGLAYAGRSGMAGSGLTDYTRGGIGCQVTAGVSHNFSRSFTGEAYVGWASHYFPSLMAKFGATWHLRSEWDFNLHASYRRMEIYSGLYRPSDYGEGYEIDHWEESKVALWQFGTSLAKMFGEQFRLSVGADGFLMNKVFYANGNVKCQYFPLEGCKNHFFVSGGLGTAPDGLMLDRATSVTFKDINGFMSMGGFVLLTRNIGAGLSGTWNTIYVRSERPSTSMIPTISQGYKNYFYINANVVIKF